MRGAREGFELTITQVVSTAHAVQAVTEVLAAQRIEGDVTPQTPLEQLYLDSADFVEVFARLEELVGVELDPDSVGIVERVEDLTQLRRLD